MCFTFVFTVCLPKLLSTEPSTLALVLYYAFAASLFNVGWASVQVSHMALVPELSPRSNARLLLNSARYAATIFSNIFVFVVFLALLHFLSPHDDKTPDKFHYLGVIVVRRAQRELASTRQWAPTQPTPLLAQAATGTVCSIIFLVGTPEPVFSRSFSSASSRVRSTEGAAPLLQNPLTAANSAPASCDGLDTPPGNDRSLRNLVRGAGSDSNPPSMGSFQQGVESSSSMTSKELRAAKAPAPASASVRPRKRPRRMTWKCWFQQRLFYQVGAVYMCTRLVVNVSQTYVPFYLLQTLHMSPLALALVPLLIYVAR